MPTSARGPNTSGVCISTAVRKLSIDQNEDVAVRQHLDGLAAEHDGGNAAATVGGHRDQVTAALLCGIDDGAVGCSFSAWITAQVTPTAAAASFTCVRDFVAAALVRCLYESAVSVTVSGSIAKIGKGIVTVIPVTFALIAFASALFVRNWS